MTTQRSLSCISPDNKYILSLQHNQSAQESFIEICKLPISNDDDQERNRIRTSLPSHLFALDEPVELLTASPSMTPLVLCLYTRKSVYLLYLDTKTFEMEEMEQPMEEILLNHGHLNIIRIRHPSSSNSVCLYPPGALVGLLSNGMVVVYHPSARSCTTPVVVQGGDLDEDEEWVDIAMDHCHTAFCLTKRGDVYAASPIVFEGMEMPSWKVEQCIQETDKAIENLSREAMPPDHEEKEGGDGIVTDEYRQTQTRRLFAQRQFYKDAFLPQSSSSSKKKLNSVCCKSLTRKHKSACLWPVLLQGPLLYGRDIDDEDNRISHAHSIEVFIEDDQNGAALSLALGYSRGIVDICYLSMKVQMRFQFESLRDSQTLNERIVGNSAILESVKMDDEDEVSTTENAIGLFVDGNDMIHYATPSGVFTIVTNVVQKFQTSLNIQSSSINTQAWSCLAVTSASFHLNGVVVCRNADLGHILIARLDSGTMETVNLTAALYLKKSMLMNFSNPPPPSQNQFQTTTTILPKPFIDQITPIINQITNIQSNMAKLIGSSTPPSKADAGTVATLIDFRTKYEEPLVSSLTQLTKLTHARKKLLKEMYKTQKQQLDTLQQQANQISQNDSYRKKFIAAEENSKIIADRSATLLHAARDLVPTITLAESEYFDQLKRYENQCQTWADKVQDLERQIQNLCDLYSQAADNRMMLYDSSPEVHCRLQLSQEQMDICRDLLTGQKEELTAGQDCYKHVKMQLGLLKRKKDKGK